MNKLDMTSGPLFREIAVFTAPLILTGLLQLLFHSVDMIVIGRFASALSLGAVGAASPLCGFAHTVFIGLSVGVNILFSTSFGAKNKEDLSKILHTSILASIVFGTIASIAAFVFADSILRLAAVPDDIFRGTRVYFRVFALSLPFTLVYNTGSAILRAVGDAKHPFYFLSIAGLVNLVLNLIFVVPAKLDVFGVALTTLLSNIFAAFLVLRLLHLSKEDFSLDFAKLAIDAKTFSNLLKVGLPAGFQNSMFSVGHIIIQTGVNSLGAYAIAGNVVASNLEGFIYVAANACSLAVTTVVAQNYGAGRIDRVVKGIIGSVCLAVMLNVVLGAIAFVFAEGAVSLYSSDANVTGYGVERLRFLSFCYVLCSIMDILTSSLRGIGSNIFPMAVTVLFGCFFRLAWVLFAFPFKRELWFLYLCLPVSWIVVSLIEFAYLSQKLAWPKHFAAKNN